MIPDDIKAVILVIITFVISSLIKRPDKTVFNIGKNKARGKNTKADMRVKAISNKKPKKKRKFRLFKRKKKKV